MVRFLVVAQHGMRKALPFLLTTAFALCVAGTAAAGTATTTFGVSLRLLSNCLVSASNLSFPNYTPAGGNQTASTTVSVRCTNSTAFTVALSAGTTSGGTLAQRLMSNGAGSTVQYNPRQG